jgi:hypothetical protein
VTGPNASEAACRLDRGLFDRGYACTLLDSGILGPQTALVAKNINLAGIICVCVAPEGGVPAEDGVNWILPADSIEVERIIERFGCASSSVEWDRDPS